MTFNNESDFDAAIAPVYRELFDQIQPSGQLLAATRLLCTGPTAKPAKRILPAAAATLCAACLLLAFGLALWPQPEDLSTNPDAQLSVASNLDESATPALNPENAPQSRMAQATPAAGIDEPNLAQEMDSANMQELCALPLAKQTDSASKPFVKPTDAAILRHCPAASAIYWLMPNWAARAINWLTMW